MRIIPEPIERPFLPNVPPCQHLKINGTQCGSPALRRNRFCFFHKRFQEEQIKLNSDRKRRSRANFVLPILEDANAIQVSLMQIMRLLASGQIDPKTAGLLPYALQTASCNLRFTTFEPEVVTDVVIDRNTMNQTCFGCSQWLEEDFEDEEEDEEDEENEPAAEAATGAAAKAQTAALVQAQEKARCEAAATIAGRRVTPQTNSTAATTSTKQTPTPSINQTQSAAIESPATLASGKPNNPESPDFDMATVRKRIQNLTVDWLLETAKQTNQTG